MTGAGAPIPIVIDEDAHVLIVDGVRIAVEVLRTLVGWPAPDPHVFFQFQRDGDSVTVTAYRVASFTIHAGES